MKKITLVLAALILTIGNMMANTSAEKVFDDVKRIYPPVDYRYAEPIAFMERGIEFYIFPDGAFDFNTVPSGPRSTTNTTYGAPRGNANGYYRNRTPQGIRIEHDNNGRVRRVGNVFINYDAVGRVKRVGTVYMSYNSFALTQVGGLHIIYDRRGRIIDIRGYVNNHSQAYQYVPTNNHYHPSNTYNNYDYDNGSGYNDEDYYYYRQDGTKAKMDNSDINTIKRNNTDNDRKR